MTLNPYPKSEESPSVSTCVVKVRSKTLQHGASAQMPLLGFGIALFGYLGIAKPVHGAIEIEAKFIQVSQRGADTPTVSSLPAQPFQASEKPRLIGVLSASNARTTIETLQKLKTADTLATPRITAESGQRASISIGREFHYPVDTSSEGLKGRNQQEKFLKKNIGVTLSVTPTLRRKGGLKLNLEPEIVESEGFVNHSEGKTGMRQPVFATERLNTIVSVRSGETVVLAMPSRQRTQIVEDRVPVLGRIPLLGRLFTNQTRVNLNQRLYLLVTPRVVSAREMARGNAGARNAVARGGIAAGNRHVTTPHG